MIKDIYGQRKGSLDEYGLIKDIDEADFIAKLPSLKSKWESHCAGFFDWFLRKRKQKMISSVICSVREGTDVCGPFYQNDVESQHFVEKVQQSFKKKSVGDAVLGFKTIIERRENEEVRAIHRAGSYRVVSFFMPAFIIRLKSKTTVFMFLKLFSEPRLLKTTQTFFELFELN